MEHIQAATHEHYASEFANAFAHQKGALAMKFAQFHENKSFKHAEASKNLTHNLANKQRHANASKAHSTAAKAYREAARTFPMSDTDGDALRKKATKLGSKALTLSHSIH